ncbi:hypothetical protein ACI798_03010 [Geodermatophilus sp. SYSU D01045]
MSGRLAGFLDAWAALGRDRDAVAVAESDSSRGGGHSATLDLLGRHPHLTAVLALDDLMAVGAARAAERPRAARPRGRLGRGLRRPVDGRGPAPALTTVRLPLEQMGARAMDLVLTAAGDAPAGCTSVPS